MKICRAFKLQSAVQKNGLENKLIDSFMEAPKHVKR